MQYKLVRIASSVVVAALALSACADVAPPTAPVPTAAFAKAPTAAASTTTANEQVPIGGILMSFCTGESLVYSGRMHIVTKTNASASGARTRVHTNYQDVKGIAVGSGRQYEIQSNGKERTEIETDATGSFEEDVYFRVISQGSLDNWFARVHVRATFDASGQRVVTTEQADHDCRG